MGTQRVLTLDAHRASQLWPQGPWCTEKMMLAKHPWHGHAPSRQRGPQRRPHVSTVAGALAGHGRNATHSTSSIINTCVLLKNPRACGFCKRSLHE